MEQGTGVEPALTAWEAAVIPIYQPCKSEQGTVYHNELEKAREICL